jgi:tetratricopeptide (TPR) repeat protein
VLINVGRHEAAQATAQEALECGRAAGDAEAAAQAGVALVASLRGLGRFDEALAVLDEAQAEWLAREAPPSPERLWIDAQLDLERADLDRHFGRLADAVALVERTLAALEAEPVTDVHDLATAYRRRATILWADGRFPAAAHDLERSANHFREAGDMLQAIFSEGNLGLVYFSMGRFDEAERAKLRAVRLAEELNAGWWLVRELGELSGLYMYRGQLAEALTFCNRHVELATQYRDVTQLALAHANRGMTLVLLNRVAEAGPDLEAALGYFKEQGRVEGIVGSTIDLVQYLHRSGRTDEAATLAAETYERARHLDYPILRLLALRCLAQFAAPDEGRALLVEALALARAHERSLDIAGCLFGLSALATSPEERLERYDKGAALLESIGAGQWLAGRSAHDPPHMPLFL